MCLFFLSARNSTKECCQWHSVSESFFCYAKYRCWVIYGQVILYRVFFFLLHNFNILYQRCVQQCHFFFTKVTAAVFFLFARQRAKCVLLHQNSNRNCDWLSVKIAIDFFSVASKDFHNVFSLRQNKHLSGVAQKRPAFYSSMVSYTYFPE